MSREAVLTIDFSMFSEEIADIIKLLTAVGWDFCCGKTEYLPIGDNDMFDWKEESLSHERLFSIIENKQNLNETTGVILYYKNTGIGITVLAKNTNQLNLLLNINRKTIDGIFTDISWYIENIAAAIDDKSRATVKINYYEYLG